MARYLSLMWKNALRNRRRSILTICSIGASFCLLAVLMTMYQALFNADTPEWQSRILVVRNRVSLTMSMPIYYRERILKVSGVEEAYVSQWFGGSYKDPRDIRNQFARFAVEPERMFRVERAMKVPEDQKKAFIADRQGCIVGYKLARKFNWKLGDRVHITGDIFPGQWEFIIRGIYEHPDESDSLMFHLTYLFESLPQGRRDFAGTFTLLADAPGSLTRISQEIDGAFRNSPVQTRTETLKAFLLSFTAFLGNVKLFLFAICAAVTFTILLVSANTIAMSVRERVREVGVMKTLGFTRESILGILVGESIVMSLLGGALGCGLAYFVALGAREAMASFVFQFNNLSLPLPMAALCMGIAGVIGAVSSLVPAWNASRTPIIDALRSTV